jgi:hypothetical protein
MLRGRKSGGEETGTGTVFTGRRNGVGANEGVGLHQQDTTGGWLAHENSKLGLYGSCPATAAEIARLAEGKLFLNFDDGGYGPALQEFLAQRFPDKSQYER